MYLSVCEFVLVSMKVFLMVKKLLQKLRSNPEIEAKTQADLKDLRDFTDFQKICKLHPLGYCLDMFNYGGKCCEEKCPIVDGIKAMEAFE
jgi:hypothetical protein